MQDGSTDFEAVKRIMSGLLDDVKAADAHERSGTARVVAFTEAIWNCGMRISTAKRWDTGHNPDSEIVRYRCIYVHPDGIACSG